MKIYKITEASVYIGVSINTLKTLADNGKIKSFKTTGEVTMKHDEAIQAENELREVEKRAADCSRRFGPNVCRGDQIEVESVPMLQVRPASSLTDEQIDAQVADHLAANERKAAELAASQDVADEDREMSDR